MICELLGVPAEDQHLFGPWSSDASRMLDGDLDDATDPAGHDRLHVARQLPQRHLRGASGRRRATTCSPALLAAEEEGDKLSEEELRSTVVLLFVAGHETTMNLIGNGTVALLRQRDQWERLVADPVAGARRRRGGAALRRAGAPHRPHGHRADPRSATSTSSPGQGVVTLLAAANRDPERFPDPDRLDITRPDNHHLTFSHGIHYCLGAALARLEGQEVFKALTQRFPTLELAEEPVHREHFVLRGYQAVHVAARTSSVTAHRP